jgi:uncharacterized protein YgiM (DUF1202 family)
MLIQIGVKPNRKEDKIMKKKYLVVILAAMCVVSLTACSSKTSVFEDNVNTESVTQVESTEENAEKTIKDAESEKAIEVKAGTYTESFDTSDGIVVYTFTEVSDSEKIMYATTTVNVRSMPTEDGYVVSTYSEGDEVTVVGQCNDTGWYHTEGGYINNEYLSNTKTVTVVESVEVESKGNVVEPVEVESKENAVNSNSSSTTNVEQSEVSENQNSSDSGSSSDSSESSIVPDDPDSHDPNDFYSNSYNRTYTSDELENAGYIPSGSCSGTTVHIWRESGGVMNISVSFSGTAVPSDWSGSDYFETRYLNNTVMTYLKNGQSGTRTSTSSVTVN